MTYTRGLFVLAFLWFCLQPALESDDGTLPLPQQEQTLEKGSSSLLSKLCAL